MIWEVRFKTSEWSWSLLTSQWRSGARPVSCLGSLLRKEFMELRSETCLSRDDELTFLNIIILTSPLGSLLGAIACLEHESRRHSERSLCSIRSRSFSSPHPASSSSLKILILQTKWLSRCVRRFPGSLDAEEQVGEPNHRSLAQWTVVSSPPC